MKQIRRHYHWVIAILAFIEMIIFGGILNSASVFIIPISTTLEVSRGSYAVATIPYSIVCTISTLVSGFLFQKFGYRRSLIIGLSVSVLSLILTATCQSLTGFCFSKILLGLGYGVCFTAGAVRIVKDWFFKHQGLVLGIVTMSSGLGGSLMTIVLTQLIQRYAWRTANLFLAGLVGLIILGYLLLMKNRPEEIGLEPYGFGAPVKISKVKRPEQHDWPGLPFHVWLRRPLLYLMSLSTLITCMAIYLTSSVIQPFFQDLGFSPAASAGYQSVCMLVLAGGKLLCGAATDKLGPKPVSIFCLICMVLGQILLSTTTHPVLCYVGVSLCGIGCCMTSLMIPLLVSPMFGYLATGNINSIALAMASLAGIFSSSITNLAHDRLGSYIPVFLVASAINGVMVVIYLLMFMIAKREKARSNSIA